MKTFINTIKTTSLSLLVITSVTSAVLLTSSTAQAGPWIALNGNICQAHRLDVGVVQPEANGIYVAANDPGLTYAHKHVYCPLKLEEAGGSKIVRVWINYRKFSHSDATHMHCRLYSSDYFGNSTSVGFTMPTGIASSVKNINSPYGGTITVFCGLSRSDAGTDRIYSFNYKIL